MRKRTVAAIVIVLLIPLLICGYVLLSGSSAVIPVHTSFNDSHFTIASISGPAVFPGESVIIQAVIVDDEPLHEVVAPTQILVSVNDSNGTEIISAVPTTKAQIMAGYCTRTITAELNGGQGVDLTRTENLTLINNESRVMVFDFGPLPPGSYVVTVTAQGHNRSARSAVVTVNEAPTLDDWTVTGDAAFMLVNLRHDTVDVDIRNDGQHVVIFGGSQYGIFANSSDSYGVALQGLNQTVVQPGQSVTVHATIPAAGGYFLDHFAIKVPGRALPVKIPVRVWMSPAA